ncbi:hypothetical protein G6O67_004890 [Ophiocordyceps sinensis]|uniref:Uncharacterized protein n=1 Tax=Ophiocordyceps sinensis TaxID=72228 RepID=A0A8H4PQG8_9HYPO|nr:hypothetical protein G6O67_004890 [Ophiocordyceps sinensis]
MGDCVLRPFLVCLAEADQSRVVQVLADQVFNLVWEIRDAILFAALTLLRGYWLLGELLADISLVSIHVCIHVCLVDVDSEMLIQMLIQDAGLVHSLESKRGCAAISWGFSQMQMSCGKKRASEMSKRSKPFLCASKYCWQLAGYQADEPAVQGQLFRAVSSEPAVQSQLFSAVS